MKIEMDGKEPIWIFAGVPIITALIIISTYVVISPLDLPSKQTPRIRPILQAPVQNVPIRLKVTLEKEELQLHLNSDGLELPIRAEVKADPLTVPLSIDAQAPAVKVPVTLQVTQESKGPESPTPTAAKKKKVDPSFLPPPKGVDIKKGP